MVQFSLMQCKRAPIYCFDVSLARCSEVTDAGVKALAKHCPGLESVNLDGCFKVTDAGVRALAENPGLKSVSLVGCFKVADAGVQAPAERYPGLE